MSLILAAGLVVIFVGGLGAVVIAVLLFSRLEGPGRAPAWLGPSVQQIEATVRAALDRRRELPLQAHPATVELARHHAFDMAMRGFDGAEDPEEVGLAGRRLRLHPSFVGHLRQWQGLIGVGGPGDPAGLAADLLASLGDLAALDQVDWNVLGVGVAAERGRLACCVVAGSWWATLEDKVVGDLPATGWVVEGVLEGGTRVDELGLRPAGPGGEARPAIALPEAAERFQLRSDEAPGTGIEVQIVRGEVEGVARPI